MAKSSIFSHKRCWKSRGLKFFHILFHLRNIWRFFLFWLNSCPHQFWRWFMNLLIIELAIKTSLMIDFLLNHFGYFRGRIIMNRWFEILRIIWFLSIIFIFRLRVSHRSFSYIGSFVDIKLKFRLRLFDFHLQKYRLLFCYSTSINKLRVKLRNIMWTHIFFMTNSLSIR